MKKHILTLLLVFVLVCMTGCGQETVRSDDAMNFVSQMGIGWNLGNSLDSTSNGASSEISWGNPLTTEEMILDIKEMGFDTVRIPVSWYLHVNMEGKVEPTWMARVKEVVNYAYDNGMYVILNSHHDNLFYDIGGCVKREKTFEASKERMKNLWAQIAEEFKDYDEHLIFETLNEPRTVGSEKEWQGGTPEEREVVYALNEVIVETIRESGGNNKDRYIMVPSYGATNNIEVLKEMKLPDDDHLIMSVHAYSPYDFAMNGDATGEFTESDRKELDSLFSALNEVFVSKNIPVVLGEFGATNKDNLEDRCAWADYYVRGAKKYNMVSIVWDNNNYGEGAEYFGLYNRREGTWYFPELAEAYTAAAGQIE